MQKSEYRWAGVFSFATLAALLLLTHYQQVQAKGSLFHSPKIACVQALKVDATAFSQQGHSAPSFKNWVDKHIVAEQADMILELARTDMYGECRLLKTDLAYAKANNSPYEFLMGTSAIWIRQVPMHEFETWDFKPEHVSISFGLEDSPMGRMFTGADEIRRAL